MALPTTLILPCRYSERTIFNMEERNFLGSLISFMYNLINQHKKTKENASRFSVFNGKNTFLMSIHYAINHAVSVYFNAFYAFLQAQWCLIPALMGHTLIQTREGYKRRGSVYPALQGSSAGTLDASQPQSVHAEALKCALVSHSDT